MDFGGKTDAYHQNVGGDKVEGYEDVGIQSNLN